MREIKPRYLLKVAFKGFKEVDIKFIKVNGIDNESLYFLDQFREETFLLEKVMNIIKRFV